MRPRRPTAKGPPTNFRAVAAHAGADGWDDMDLGSGGPVVVPSANAVVGAGKDGVVYVLDRDDLGKTAPGDVGTPAGNYAKLKSPPIFFTYFPGFDHNPAPANIQELHPLGQPHASPARQPGALGRAPTSARSWYCWGENENLRAWAIDATGKVTYLARGAEQASIQAPVPPGGMPGGMLTLFGEQRSSAHRHRLGDDPLPGRQYRYRPGAPARLRRHPVRQRSPTAASSCARCGTPRRPA